MEKYIIQIYLKTQIRTLNNNLSILEEIKHIVVFGLLLLLLILVVSKVHLGKIVEESLIVVILLLVLLLLLMLFLSSFEDILTKGSDRRSIFGHEGTDLFSVIVCVLADFLRVFISNIGCLLSVLFGGILLDQVDAI